jgi:type IV pilus assembly protein PilC
MTYAVRVILFRMFCRKIKEFTRHGRRQLYMSHYSYEAVDSGGLRIAGSLDVPDQSEALRRIKEMGFFPTKIAEARGRKPKPARPANSLSREKSFAISIPFLSGHVRSGALTVFTRQLATLIDSGMPLLRGLRLLEEQETSPALKRLLQQVSQSIESGSSLSEALAAHPKIFDRLYVNMVRAGELGGALEITLRRLAEFREKSQKIRRKVVASLFYPVTVLFVATAIVAALMIFIVPKFQAVFQDLLHGDRLPALTTFVLNLSHGLAHHVLAIACSLAALFAAFQFVIHTRGGRLAFDRVKLSTPVVGTILRKTAITRFARTLGTLLNNGVPVLQALTVVRETAGNVIVGNVVGTIHESVKEGGTLSVPLRGSGVFPVMVAGMVDIGEQTGALPDMLMKIADGYDEEVDAAVTGLTSLIEPIMIILLAVIVGGIVVAMFLPLIKLIDHGFDSQPGSGGDM